MKLNRVIDKWKRSILIISCIPAIILGVIIVKYDLLFENFFRENEHIIEYINFKSILMAFNNIDELPIVIQNIGIDSILFLQIAFLFWVILFFLGSYSKLSESLGSKIEMIFELSIIAGVFFVLISPDSLIINLLMYLYLALCLSIVAMYWIYQLKNINEKG